MVLTNTSTNGSLASITNGQGRYVFTNVQPGPYTLDVKKDGFNEAAVKNPTVEVSKTLTLNIPM